MSSDIQLVDELKQRGFDVQGILQKLQTLPEQLKVVGVLADEARAAKTQKQIDYVKAKNFLEVAKAQVILNMPDNLKNEMQRNAYVQDRCSGEIQKMIELETGVLAAEIEITNKMRDFYALTDMFESVKVQADLMSSVYKYLSVR